MDKGAHWRRCDLQVHTPRDRNWTGKASVTDEERLAYAVGSSCRTICNFRGIASGRSSAMTRLAIRSSALAPGTNEIVVDACAFDRDKRIASARALGERIERYLDGDRDVVRRRELAREHFDNAQPGLLRFDFTAVINPSHPL